MNAEKRKPAHRWSGWPGAWCLDCGMGDPLEWCVANHVDGCQNEGCQPGECPEPGSKRHDPYATKGVT